MRDYQNEQPISRSDVLLWSKPLTADIRPLFSGHGLEWRGGIGPGQQVVDLVLRVTGDDAGDDVGEVTKASHMS